MDNYTKQKLAEKVNSLQDIYYATGGMDTLVLYEQFSYILLGYCSLVFKTVEVNTLRPLQSMCRDSIPPQVLSFGPETLRIYQEALDRMDGVHVGQRNRLEIQLSNSDVFGMILDIITMTLPPDSDCFSKEDLQYLAEHMLGSCVGKSRHDYLDTPQSLAAFVWDLLEPPSEASVYDPSCGSGAFLVAAGRLFNRLNSVEGNEQNTQWRKTAQLNLLFHGLLSDVQDLGIFEQYNQDRQFDYVISNPPFTGAFSADTSTYDALMLPVPTKNGYRAFIQMALSKIRQKGRGAFIVPDSFLFGGNTEIVRVREWMLQNFVVDGIVSLPSNTFYPKASVKSSLLVLTALPRKETVPIHAVAMIDSGPTSRKKPVGPTDFEEVLQLWPAIDKLRENWNAQMGYGARTNLHGAAAPADWEYTNIWFADMQDIQRMNCCLLPQRYQPVGAFQMSREAPQSILQEVMETERQILDTLESLEKELLNNA